MRPHSNLFTAPTEYYPNSIAIKDKVKMVRQKSGPFMGMHFQYIYSYAFTNYTSAPLFVAIYIFACPHVRTGPSHGG